MNHNHYEILKILYNNNKNTPINSMSIKELSESNKIQLSNISIYRELSKLKASGLIQYGLRSGKEHTYYITKLGIQIKEQLEGIAV